MFLASKLKSSVISSVMYDNGNLIVIFNSGKAYTYKNVDSVIAAGLLSATSVGKYFNTQIKGKYDVL